MFVRRARHPPTRRLRAGCTAVVSEPMPVTRVAPLSDLPVLFWEMILICAGFGTSNPSHTVVLTFNDIEKEPGPQFVGVSVMKF
jgi:hypothetical protein